MSKENIKFIIQSIIGMAIGISCILVVLIVGLGTDKKDKQSSKPIVLNCYAIQIESVTTTISANIIAYAIADTFSASKEDRYAREDCQHYADVKVGEEEMTYGEFLRRIELNYTK